ncbi:MAG: tryptophan-rich sensory protein [bacterium]|nr:tryptophan-rich sensory protein [bacterium]
MLSALVVLALPVFALAGVAVFYLWTKYQPREIRFWFIITLLVSNVVLNVLWSFLFFTERMLGAATINAGALLIITSFIIFLAWPNAKKSSLLLLPYGLWLVAVSYMSYVVWALN